MVLREDSGEPAEQVAMPTGGNALACRNTSGSCSRSHISLGAMCEASALSPVMPKMCCSVPSWRARRRRLIAGPAVQPDNSGTKRPEPVIDRHQPVYLGGQPEM